MASLSLADLPIEVIQQVLLYVPPPAVATFQQVCRRFNSLVEPLLWRRICLTEFKYWSPHHRIKEKFRAKIEEVDWKSVYAGRYRIDRITTKILDSILSSQTGRIEKFQAIVECGYDAKDTLIQHSKIGDDASDVLARRYYSDAVLGHLHRIMAIEEWSKLKDRQELSLERALAAFDMFVLHDREGDLDEIAARLDDIANDIQAECPDLAQQTPRLKALSIASYLRAHNLTGISDGRHFTDLQNNFIGIALQDENHPSLPLISTAVFCCVARRLGLSASACSFPFHVVAIIKPAHGYDMDGKALKKTSAPAPPMYMDPFQSDEETPVKDLLAQLRALGASQGSHAKLIEAAPIAEIVLRTGRNILTSVQDAHRNAILQNGINGHETSEFLYTFPDMESAFYGALWASLLLGIPANGDGPVVAALQRRNYLPHIVEHFETHFPTDVSLIERYIAPLFQNLGEHAQLRESVRAMRTGDSMPKQRKRRTSEISKQVRYRVGQVFQHKRYNYQAVITGWDVECGASEQWMAQMRVYELSRGRNQSFYHVLVEDKDVRYVAQENIEIITPDYPKNLIPLAGRHFKRWDRENSCFISNINDEYPDD